MALRDALDLSTWKQIQGYGSIHGPICPYCGKQLPPPKVRPNGVACCTNCDKTFRWTLQPSPMGPAFFTARIVDNPEPKTGG